MNPLSPFDLVELALESAGRAVAGAAEVAHGSATPCQQWDLGTLVRHVADSARTLQELLAGIPAGPLPLAGCSAAQAAIGELADVVGRVPHDDSTNVVALLGSYELAIHAWDVAQATGRDACLPDELVDGLLVHAPLVIDDRLADLFAPPITLSRAAPHTDEDVLLAMFGRCRDWR